MTREKLKPCPFCGGKAEIYSDSSFSSHVYYRMLVWVKCSKCGIKTQAFESHRIRWNQYTADTDIKEAKITPIAEAIEFWNKRGDE